MSITVAIVNHNTCDHLRACLASVRSERPDQLIVVDNASTDGSQDMVTAEYPEVQLVRADNGGFGAGANIALHHARLPYVLLLNSDTRVYPGALARLSDYLDVHPRVGMIGPRLVNPDGSLQPSVYPLPSPAAELMRWTSLGKLAVAVPMLRRRYYLAWPHDKSGPAGWVVGAALAIRKEAFDAIGGFDTSFFMYSEEVDLAYRMQEAGWRVDYVPEATVAHVGGASTAAYRGAMTARLYASMHHFYRKHYGRGDQRRLQCIISYFMVRNWLRDRWRLRKAGAGERPALADDVAAWRRVLRETWSRAA